MMESLAMDGARTDKRRFERVPVSVPTRLYFHEAEEPLASMTADLGLEGARFCSERRLRAGAPVLVRLQLGPDKPIIECKGKVCWAGDGDEEFTDFGVRFLDLRDDEREALRRFLERS